MMDLIDFLRSKKAKKFDLESKYLLDKYVINDDGIENIDYNNYVPEYIDLYNFYNQKFRLSMIIKYFQRTRNIPKQKYTYGISTLKYGEFIISFSSYFPNKCKAGWMFVVKSENYILYYPNEVKTLGDFIHVFTTSDSNISNIYNLYWKK